MVFKKFDEQQVYQVSCTNPALEGELTLKVGDVFSVTPVTHEISKVVNKAAAVEAIADQNALYLVAQSDAVTEKTGTAYKSYAMDDSVTIKAEETKIVAAYRITDIENVEWEA